MPFRKRASSSTDRDRADDSAVVDETVVDETGSAETDGDVLSLADEAEAEAAEAEALAAAARARARALRLRRQAEEAEQARAARAAAESATPAVADDTDTIADDTESDTSATDTVDEAAVDDDTRTTPAKGSRRPRRALRIPLPTWRGVAFTAAILVIAALLSASGYMIWHHREVNRTAQLTGEYSAASRQAVVTLMSLDFNNAEEDVQRIIDNSTGKFRDDFQAQAETFAQVAQESKVVTEVTVNSTAVKTMDDTTANVLVSATSRVTNTSGANQDPRAWRLSVDLQRDGDQIKMSRVEFVP